MSDGIKRRDFLKVLGVTGAGAAVSGCSYEPEKIIPYVVPPEEITPGISTWYTTVSGECGTEAGLWARTREGRVVKLEGNPNHPVSRGGLNVRAHAALQGLYNPDRIAAPMARQNGTLTEITWDEAEQMLADRIQGSMDRVLMITGTMGPSMTDLASRFLGAAGGRHVEHKGISEAPLREATRIAFGRDVVPKYDFEGLDYIVSFGADFLETWGGPEYAAQFAESHAADEEGHKARFAFVGPHLNLTGQNADDWVPVDPGHEHMIALAMANIIAAEKGTGGPYASILANYDVDTVASVTGVEADFIRDMADKFSHGPSVAVGIDVASHHRNATAANLAVLVLNAVNGNVGQSVHLGTTSNTTPSRPYGEMEAVIQEMAGGAFGVAIVRGTNPAYTLPAASGFRDAFGAVPFKVAFATEPDETTALADLVLPDRHFLEAWGDSNPTPGVYAIQQPVMAPVPHFDSRPAGDVLLNVATRMGSSLGPETTFEHVQNRWMELHASMGSSDSFEVFWKTALKTGAVTVGMNGVSETAELRAPDAALSFDVPELDGDGEFALIVYPGARFGDGASANRPWLQEVPDSISKITWHSWVEIHPNTAERLGVGKNDVVRVTSPYGSVEAPVFTYPGIREGAIALQMGHGRTDSGRYATGKGVNAISLLPAVAEQPSGGFVQLVTRVSVEPTGERYRLATIEGSDSQSDRNVAPAMYIGALGHGEDDHSADAEAGYGDEDHSEGGYGEEEHGRYELDVAGGFVPVATDGKATDYPTPGGQRGNYADPETPRWGVAIDLDKCTGCSACIVACQSENNVAFVGEDQVRMGRDLAWIRLERYYEHVDASHAGHLDIRHLPMMCQHCNNAPCEPVCPVFAAYHTPDGLNGQVYNRCVGTRYCANNCPYKVRVYNWYTYSDVPEPLNWQYNPDVTVRVTGVMEKCSMCVQRIREGEHRAVLEGRSTYDGEILTACQQSCPASAIVFGNLRDPESEVSKMVENERTYRVLDELINTQPGVHYLQKVTFHEVESGH